MRQAVSRLGGWAVSATIVLLLTAYPPNRLTAQVSPDTVHLMRPMSAFWRSLLVPGWGQAATGRHVTGAAFVVWEGVTMMMTLKAQEEAKYMKEVGSANLRAKRQEVQDWLVLWIFNHLFAGAEAYVSAHLQDFPPELNVRAVPHGLGVSLPLPHR